MTRIFVTGSSTGLGRNTAEALLDEGHEVVLHARSDDRVMELADRAVGVVVGDLERRDEVRRVAEQADSHGPLDAVIHNAGVFGGRARAETADGHARVFAVNVLAPYALTALMQRPARLVYLSSGMHRDGDPSLRDLDWVDRRWNGVQAYCDSKLHVTALALALARRWPEVRSNAVDPGWVPTRMGGSGATDDLTLGHVTQAWLAVTDGAAAEITGGYWYHQEMHAPAPAAGDADFQDALVDELERLTGVPLG